MPSRVMKLHQQKRRSGSSEGTKLILETILRRDFDRRIDRFQNERINF